MNLKRKIENEDSECTCDSQKTIEDLRKCLDEEKDKVENLLQTLKNDQGPAAKRIKSEFQSQENKLQDIICSKIFLLNPDSECLDTLKSLKPKELVAKFEDGILSQKSGSNSHENINKEIIDKRNASNQTEEPLELNENWSCEVCGFIGKSLTSLKIHKKLKNHSVDFQFKENAVHVCKFCDLDFESEAILNQHQNEENHLDHEEIMVEKEDSNADEQTVVSLIIGYHQDEVEMNPFKCQSCNFVGKSTKSLSVHNSKQHKTVPKVIEEPFIQMNNGVENSCSECSFVGKSLQSLVMHQRRKHQFQKRFNDEQPKIESAVIDVEKIDEFPCEFCEYVGKSLKSTRAHKGWRHKDNSFTELAKNSEDIGMNSEKSAIHSEETVKNLEIFSNSSEETVKNSEESSTNNPFKCQLCQFVGKNNVSLSTHLRWKHSTPRNSSTEKISSIFNCQLCEFVGKNQLSLDIHKRRKHVEKKPAEKENLPDKSSDELDASFKCQICSFIGKNQFSLNCHVRMLHNVQKTLITKDLNGEPAKIAEENSTLFSCEKCSYVGKTKVGLVVHSRKKHKIAASENGEKTEETSMEEISNESENQESNGLKITQIYSLLDSIKPWKTGKQRFTCNNCHAIFTNIPDKKNHMEKCALDEPYKCPFCPYVGAGNFSLQIHVRLHQDSFEDENEDLLWDPQKFFDENCCLVTNQPEIKLHRVVPFMPNNEEMMVDSTEEEEEVNEFPTICKNCNKKFYSELMLKFHVCLNSNSFRKHFQKFTCNICHSSFKSLKTKKYHMIKCQDQSLTNIDSNGIEVTKNDQEKVQEQKSKYKENNAFVVEDELLEGTEGILDEDSIDGVVEYFQNNA